MNPADKPTGNKPKFETLEEFRKRTRPPPPFVPRLAREAKAIVALAFRNGPIEDVHAGKTCPTCAGDPQYSHITDHEMQRIMKKAVNRVYAMLYDRESNPERYEADLRLGDRYTASWDDPELGS